MLAYTCECVFSSLNACMYVCMCALHVCVCVCVCVLFSTEEREWTYALHTIIDHINMQNVLRFSLKFNFDTISKHYHVHCMCNL